MVQRSAAAAKQSAEAIAKAAKDAAWKKRQARNNRLYFPNEIMYHVPWVGKHEANNDEGKVVKFRVSPKMTKIEMKNWIELGYDTPVNKVSIHQLHLRTPHSHHQHAIFERPRCAQGRQRIEVRSSACRKFRIGPAKQRKD